MTLYLLDTDHLSHYHRGHAAVRKHLTGKTPSQVFTSVITAEEILRGRLAQIRAAKTEAEQIKACYWLVEALELLKEFAILPYDQLASQHYQMLMRLSKRQVMKTATPIKNTANGQTTAHAWLGVEAANSVQLVQAIGAGFPFAALERVRKETGLPLERLGSAIGLSARTLTRRKKEKKLSAAESDRLVTLARLLSQAIALFEGSKQSALRWFVQPNRALGNLSPLDMAATETGAREVENLIGRLEHGVFS